MPSRISIQEISRTSGVKFGTSGARGLVVDMTDRVCAAYTLAFLQSLENESRPGAPLAIGGDLRPSTPRILSAIARAAQSVGREVRYLGLIPSPAVALYGLEERCPTVMVTGSHIPADRNGMKFTTERGEITKADEARILAQQVELSLPFDESGRRRPLSSRSRRHGSVMSGGTWRRSRRIVSPASSSGSTGTQRWAVRCSTKFTRALVLRWSASSTRQSSSPSTPKRFAPKT
jgi:hypothetical protein